MAIGLCFALNPLSAQQAGKTLYGTLTDTEGHPVTEASVSFSRLPDSTRSNVAVIDGIFFLKHASAGAYLLQVQAPGYLVYPGQVVTVTERDNTDTIPPIILDKDNKTLQEITITEKTPFIEYKADKVIIDARAFISNAGTTAFDMLERSPGVMVQNGVINLKGKQGVMVWIDHKPSYLSGMELENYLRSVPAAMVAKIELMTNPPAKYDAAGNAGIINIITQKQNSKGFNGGINMVLAQNRYTTSNNTIFANLRKNKLNVALTLNGGYRQNIQDLSFDRQYYNEKGSIGSMFRQNAREVNRGFVSRGKLVLDYYQNDRTTWGISLSGNAWSRKLDGHIDGLFTDNDGAGNFQLNGRNTGTTNHTDGLANLNYRHQFRQPDREITVDADYLSYAEKGKLYWNNTIIPAGNTGYEQDLLTGILPSAIHIYTVKADYAQPIQKGLKLDAGIKSAFTETDHNAGYTLTAKGIATPDYVKSNHFIYKENIHAAYLNLSGEKGKLSAQAGLRAENTVSDGRQPGNPARGDSSFSRRYTSLFPTFYVLYKIDSGGNHTVGINYGRRINRPYFQDLNPIITPIDKFTYYSGNPFLKAAFAQNIELAYSYRNNLTATFSYNNSKDNVNETVAISNGIFYSRPQNIGKSVVTSFNVDASHDITAWLSGHLYAEWGHIHTQTDFYTGQLDTKGSYVMINPDFRIMLGKSWNAELSGRYISSVRNVQMVTDAYWLMNIGIQKKIAKAMTLKLTVRDLFYTQVNNGRIHNLDLSEASWKNRNGTQMAVLSFSYRFGKAIADQRKHESSGMQHEQGRIKG